MISKDVENYTEQMSYQTSQSGRRQNSSTNQNKISSTMTPNPNPTKLPKTLIITNTQRTETSPLNWNLNFNENGGPILPETIKLKEPEMMAIHKETLEGNLSDFMEISNNCDYILESDDLNLSNILYSDCNMKEINISVHPDNIKVNQNGTTENPFANYVQEKIECPEPIQLENHDDIGYFNETLKSYASLKPVMLETFEVSIPTNILMVENFQKQSENSSAVNFNHFDEMSTQSIPFEGLIGPLLHQEECQTTSTFPNIPSTENLKNTEKPSKKISKRKKCIRNTVTSTTSITKIQHPKDFKPHKCLQCKSCFRNPSRLSRHIRLQHFITENQCKKCGYGFPTPTCMLKHEQVCKGESFQQMDQISTGNSKNSKTNEVVDFNAVSKDETKKCPECKFLFQKETQLTWHMDKFHSGNPEATELLEKLKKKYSKIS